MTKNHIRTPGPIATRLISDARKLQRQKIIDLNAIRSAKAYLDDMMKSNEKYNLSEYDRLHALYIECQHRIADFFEQLSYLKYSNKFWSRHESAEDIYMPVGPPMSPVTKSFFSCWSAFDMCVGLKKETVTSTMIDFYRALGVDQRFIEVLEIMQASYNGLYIHEGNDDKFVYLREIYTGEMHKTLVPAGYKGIPGETWLVRLFPSPFLELFDYSIAFTTPYVIMNIPISRNISTKNIKPYSTSEWLEFISRNLSSIKTKTKSSYYQFMKYSLEKHYWLEYVTLAYVSSQADMILLTGFPDQPTTLPHHPINEEKMMASV